MTDAAAPLPGAERAQAVDKRVRALIAVGRARVSNAWLRVGASGIVAAVATSIVGNLWPLAWFAGLLPVVICDRMLYAWLLRRCETDKRAPPIRLLFAYTMFGSTYGNILAAILYFAPYVPGETLAVFYMCGGLANASATLRPSPALSIAGAGPTIVFLLGLPILHFILGGGQNSLDLMPLIGGLLLLGFCGNLWRSLVAADAAQIRAEEAVLRERQSAASAAAAKTDMIARMNSELRTPMQALVGAAEHLRRAAVSPQARAQIATLVQAGEVLKLVLDDFSDLDRLENGLLRIEPKPADPRELARSVISAFRTSAHDKNLELFLDVSPSVPPLVAMDTLRVRQILFNLLANAIRYTVHGGVRVRIGAQAVDADHTRLMFHVADTGPGMSRAQLAMIFGRLRVSCEGEGAGLGLAISMRLAKVMGGHLTARSELGEGSVFTFMLEAPLVEASASAPQETAELAR